MSLPSRARFYKDGSFIGHVFVNCGWFYDGMDSIIRVIEKDIIDINCQIPDDFDYVKIYEETFTKREFNILMKTINHYYRDDSLHNQLNTDVKIPIIKKCCHYLSNQDIVNVDPLTKSKETNKE